MTDKSNEFIGRLKDAEQISPAMRASYQAELDAMLNPKLTARPALVGTAMLIALLTCTVLIVRNMFIFKVSTLVLLSWAVLAVAFTAAGWLIARDLWRGKHSPKSVFSIGHILTLAAGAITVASLLIGISEPDKP